MGDNNGNGDSVAAAIEKKLKSLPNLSPNCCIYRVPQNLRKVNEDAYRPLVVSIGPFYYNKDTKLQPMQDHKLRYLQSFFEQRLIANNCDMSHFVRFIRQQQQKIRNCYAQQFNELDDDTFVEMVFVDTIFIIELFLRDYLCGFGNIPKTCYIHGEEMTITLIHRDIRLEENQLPFFILQDVYNMAFLSSSSSQNHDNSPPFVNLTYNVLWSREDNLPNSIKSDDIKHFIDFLRMCYLPSTLRVQRDPNGNDDQIDTHAMDVSEPSRGDFPPRVSKLSEAGVRFKVSESHNLLDIRITNKGGVLEMPKLRVEDHTETLFRNIMVFEQCHYHSDSYIVDYFALLDDLIDNEKDVEILIQNGILVDWLGSNEDVAKVLNNINKQTLIDDKNFYYSILCKHLTEQVKNNTWNRWKADFQRKYFTHPWAGISVIYAIIILILTVLQVMTGFTSFGHSKSKLNS